MPGFIATINTKIRITPSNETTCLIESKLSEKYCIERRTNRKFGNDKFFYENDSYIFLLDGVVFNNHLLIEKYKAVDWRECVERMHSENPKTFYNEFRGSFLGFVYDKKLDEWLFYTDHVGDKQIFYTCLSDGGWLIGTEMSYVVDTLRANNQPITLNKDAAYMAVTLGYVIEDNTLVKEISKLIAGHYLVLDKNQIQEFQYHRFTNIPVEKTKEEYIDGIDRLFRDAVKMQFEKDKEYGYKHMACLSGGLDSRMTVWVAHDLGYTHQLNMTFSQSNYADFQVAQQIATDLRHDFMYKALDGGNCIYDIDSVSKLSYGMACFFGLSHTYSMFNKLNYQDYGIIHSGMIGDVVIGSYLTSPEYLPAKISDGAYSLKLKSKLNSYKFKYLYENAEIYMMYNRGFGFCGQGALAYGHEYTETFSPFYNVEFLEWCFSIPLKWRYNHEIYFDWVLSKYPKAANYIWEKVGMTILEYRKQLLLQQKQMPIERHYMTVLGMQIPSPRDPFFGEYVKGFMLRRLGLRKKMGKQIRRESNEEDTYMLLTKENMNPVDYWYYNNTELKEFMDKYWKETKHIVKDDGLLKDLTYLYEDSKATYDKLQSLTVLAAYRLIFEK